MAAGVMSHYATGFRVKSLASGVYVFGATEPILSVLDYEGFPIEDFFLIGINDKCGTIIFPSEERARRCAAALEPGHRAQVAWLDNPRHPNEWKVSYDLRETDGSVRSHFVTQIAVKDPDAPGGERIVLKDGRWVDGRKEH